MYLLNNKPKRIQSTLKRGVNHIFLLTVDYIQIYYHLSRKVSKNANRKNNRVPFVDTTTVRLIKEMKRSSSSDKGCATVCRGSRIFTFSFIIWNEKKDICIS